MNTSTPQWHRAFKYYCIDKRLTRSLQVLWTFDIPSNSIRVFREWYLSRNSYEILKHIPNIWRLFRIHWFFCDRPNKYFLVKPMNWITNLKCRHKIKKCLIYLKFTFASMELRFFNTLDALVSCFTLCAMGMSSLSEPLADIFLTREKTRKQNKPNQKIATQFYTESYHFYFYFQFYQ